MSVKDGFTRDQCMEICDYVCPFRMDAASSTGSASSSRWMWTSSSRSSRSQLVQRGKKTWYVGFASLHALQSILLTTMLHFLLKMVRGQNNELPLHILCQNTSVHFELLRCLVSSNLDAVYATAAVSEETEYRDFVFAPLFLLCSHCCLLIYRTAQRHCICSAQTSA